MELDCVCVSLEVELGDIYTYRSLTCLTWAEITLRQHHLWPSQCFVLIKPVELKMGSKKGYICVSITVDG